MSPELTTVLEPVPASAVLARTVVYRELERWGCDDGMIECALLVVTELVANVILHAETEARLDMRRSDGSLRIAVSDGSPEPPELDRPGDPLDLGRGRGLILVEELSHDWGVEEVDGGKTVWAEWRLHD